MQLRQWIWWPIIEFDHHKNELNDLELQKNEPSQIALHKFELVLGRTQFVGSEFGIFGGFGWVCSSVLVGKPGFGRVRSSDLEFGELWRTLDILFWTQYHLIFG